MTKSAAMTQFAEQITEIIRSRGLTMSAAARLIGMDHGNLSRILSGKEGLTLERAERIANALDVDLVLNIRKKEKIAVA